MIEQSVLVIETGAGYVRVRAQNQSECARCAEGKGCGGATFARLFGDKITELAVPCDEPFQVGDRVQLGVEESFLVRASLRQYGLPLLMVLLVALLASVLRLAEWQIVLLSLLALLTTVFYTRLRALEYERAVHILGKSSDSDCGLARSL